MSQPHVIEPSTTTRHCVIWLHGLGADRFDFVPVVDALDLPDDHGIRFIFPQAPTRPVTINGGFPMPSWYDILGMAPARAISHEQMQESADTVLSLVNQQIAAGVPAEHIVLAGFSQGGAVVLHAAMQSDLTLGGVMALSTYGPTLDTLVEGKTARPLAVFCAHGLNDEMVKTTLGRQAHDVLEAAGHQVEWHDYPMGHEVCPAQIADIRQWLITRLGL
ncbi:MAG: alpha/beta hydrolase [Pseudomonas sp.]|uniref:alpha/beta hydrolase n=1 Tax=Halopseudomonas laoshanensis TaxID=2268758 RepID=UPI001B42F078|nr:alpha/beta hydrolase [Pseudomonas sp.]MBQ0776780.1 alpha/beta hydrolase [Pseudomonas sp.]WOD10698.1 alpha/beta hydrolase [Pseudomonas sp. NyZ704]